MKFGYEYEKVWMAVSDNNPLFGSFTFAGGYSACPNGAAIPGGGNCSNVAGTPVNLSSTVVSDTYFADFLFGTTSIYFRGQSVRRSSPPAVPQRLCAG